MRNSVRLFGYFATLLLIITYIIYAFVPNLLWFTISNIIATTCLTLYAFLIRDTVFVIVNLFIDMMLVWKLMHLI